MLWGGCGSRARTKTRAPEIYSSLFTKYENTATEIDCGRLAAG
jgi:hypothetical protein